MDNLKQTVKCPTCGRGKAPDGVCIYCTCNRVYKVIPKLSPTEQEAVIAEAKEYLAKKPKGEVPESKFTFTHATILTFMQGIMAMALEQSRVKNADYASVAGSTNTGLANFYETARRYGGSPLHALAVHRLKHELSIEKMLRGEELKSEPIMGRIIDAINYNVLALALYIETRQDMELLNEAADKMAALGVRLGTTDYNYSKDNNR